MKDNFELFSLVYKIGISIYTINEDRKYLTSVHFNNSNQKKLRLFISREASACEIVTETELIALQTTEDLIDEMFNRLSCEEANHRNKIHNSDSTENTKEEEETIFASRVSRNLLSIIPERSDRFETQTESMNYASKGSLDGMRRPGSKAQTQLPKEIDEEDLEFDKREKKKIRTEAPKNGSLIKEQLSQENIISNESYNPLDGISRKPTILEETSEYHLGTVKYFDSLKDFGFITPDNEVKELFFHYHDVNDERLSKEVLSLCKVGIVISVKYRIMSYMGKYQLSRKAVQVKIQEEDRGQS